MKWTLLAVAQIVISGPPVANPPRQPSHYIFSGQDYPAEAVRNHWEGLVVVDLAIDTNGSPKSCSIIKSSVHKILDDTTCDLLMKRAKFRPAKDKFGNAAESRYRPPSVEWRLNR